MSRSTFQVTVAGNLRVYATVDMVASSPEEAEKMALTAIENNEVDFTYTNGNGKSVSGDVSNLEVLDDMTEEVEDEGEGEDYA